MNSPDMLSHTRAFLEPYNFDGPLQLTVEQRFKVTVQRVQKQHDDNGYAQFLELPPIAPSGFTPHELEDAEHRLGFSLPNDYSRFLLGWRYLDIDCGLRIGDSWISEQHRPPYKYFVFADYWNYADGDQLMFDLNVPDTPVVLYLHEHGPLIEYFAPSFSLALWRMVHERCE